MLQLAAAELPPPQRLERATGEARIGFRLRDGATVLDDLYQAGSAKLRLPRRHAGAALEAVVINTSGGLTDGDRFSLSARWREGTTAALASQAAERIYRSRGGDATIVTRLAVGDGATAFWLPQETILFDGGRVRRTTSVELGEGARFLGVESLVLGRAAMGETVRTGAGRERFEVRAGGRLVWADAFALESGPGGDIAALLDRPAVAAGARAVATLIAAGPDPDHLREVARAAAGEVDAAVPVAASRSGDLVVARLMAHDGAALRAAMIRLARALKSALLEGRSDIADPAALPRVWAL